MTDQADLLPTGSSIDLTTCDREPIHTPGSIQSHGALLVARVQDGRVTHASANISAAVLGRRLVEVIGSRTCADIDDVLRDESALIRVCSAVLPTDAATRCDLVVHKLDERIYAEFEPVDDGAERESLPDGAHTVIQSLRRARTRQELCERAAREIKVLTGYERVMAYRFDTEGNGEVVAEACDDTLTPFLGLRFPASDIPKQARRLYLQQRVRVIVDVDYTPIPFLADPAAADAAPVDLSFCGLRGISPMHIHYLRNMGVRATLAISIIQDDVLWGMLICHSGSPRRVSPQLRALCDLIGQLMSLLIAAKGRSELLEKRLERQYVLDAIGARALSANSIVDALIENSDDFLRLVAADGAMIRIGGKIHLLGRTPDLADAVGITSALRAQSGGEPVSTDALSLRRPEFAAFADTASGVLTLPTLHSPEDAITWFRGEVTRNVTWGGNPEKAVEEEDGRLSPRKSFAAWASIVRHHSDPWDDGDIEIALDLRRIVTTFLLRQAESHARLAKLRLYDALTNLPNRRALQERMEARAADPDARDAAMIFLDLDRFKTINDTLGHATGDELLIQVANRLFEIVPERHLVARLGGDEFVVLCEETTAADLKTLVDDIIAGFRSPFVLAGRPYRLTTSVGVAAAPTELSPSGPADLMRCADMAMYAAKQKGGNQAVVFDAALQEAAGRRPYLEQDLYDAVGTGQFELHYQPIVSVATGAVSAFEALLRWRHPKCGLIAPIDFIPLAEEAGMMVPIGIWVLREALRQLAVWRQLGHCSLVVSVNISGQQVACPDFPGTVAGALAAAGLPSSALLLEVTESILMQSAAVAHLRTVHDSGVRIAVDDFGTGYSSLAFLQELPVDELKIDKLFIDRLAQDPRQAEFVNVLIRLGQTLGLRVVAEGVEEEKQWRRLQSQFCDAAQGYLFGRPLPALEAELALKPKALLVPGPAPKPMIAALV